MASKLQAARQETRDAVAALHSAHGTCQETAEELREARAAQATGERRLQDLRRASALAQPLHACTRTAACSYHTFLVP